MEGDRIFVNKLAYDLKVPYTTWHIAAWGVPQRGEIVVFYSPNDGKRLVKRVVGIPGDSRYFGFVERRLIVGQATSIVVSLDINDKYQPRWERFFTELP